MNKPDNILGLIGQSVKEKAMAQAKLKQLPIEVAQIVYYLHGNETAHMLRYTDMKVAKKQFEQLVKAREAGKPMTLTGSHSTDVIFNCGSISTCSLVDVEVGIFLFCEYQKRINARMTGG